MSDLRFLDGALTITLSGSGSNNSTVQAIEIIPQNQLSVPGDANGDGKVDGIDFTIWLANYGR